MDPWKRVGAAVKDRRLHLGWTQQESAERARVSLATWRLIESAGRDRYQDLTVRGVARALGWPPNAFAAIVAGGEPPSPDEIQAPVERTGAVAPAPVESGSLPSGFARKYLDLTHEEQAMVLGYVEGLTARRNR
jgi:transcriptional regulator with XRE-family HTH domain